MSRTYYQSVYFDEEELMFAEQSIDFYKKRKDILEKNKNDDTDNIEEMKKLRRIETSIYALKYYYGI
jgi:hypothetical protein